MMTDDAKQAAWREYCRKLEAIGVDPYAPDVPNNDPRHEQVAAIVAEYDGSTTHKLALPPNWEGHEPTQPVDSLPDLAEWLAFQWSMVKGWELAGDDARPTAMADASRAIRNAFRVLEWLGVDDRPERPMPANDVETAKSQIDDLERWIRKKHKAGWKASPKPALAAPAKPSSAKKKLSDAIPDDEANILIRKFLEQNPKATSREVASGVGIALGRVPQMAAWRAEVGRRKAAKPAPKKSAIPLTRKMTESIKRGDDPAKVAMLREQVWDKIISAADGKRSELERLHAMTTAEKDRLIDAGLEHFSDHLEEEDDD
ncbi:MAG: hypothetical protein U0941_23715 [Planctomycetaceae bacterium]